MARPLSVPVCERCRRRKQRCDSELQPCSNCTDASVECMIADPESGKSIPRMYVLQLEDHLARLRNHGAEARPAEGHPSVSPSADRGQRPLSIPASVSVSVTSRYLGASSGLAFVESAVRLAQSRRILDPDDTATDGIDDVDTSLPTQQEMPNLHDIIPPLPTPPIPERTKMQQLFGNFSKLQWQYMIIDTRDFDVHLDRFYCCEQPHLAYPASTTVIYMIFAITVHFAARSEGNITASNVADAYHEKALALLGTVARQRTIHSLQAILLILLFSLVNPQKPIVWHLLGSAMRLAAALRIHTEHGCRQLFSEFGDVPRGLFWSLYSMDRAVGNTLGRPTAIQDGYISAEFPSRKTLYPLQPAPTSSSTGIATHCFRLRKLQSEVADQLYHTTNPIRTNYLSETQDGVDRWKAQIPLGQCTPDVLDWFHHSYYNITMFIHRPSPANPQPCSADLERCFEAASHVLRIYARLHSRSAIDTTWMAVHWLFLAAVTHLFCLWSDIKLRETANWNQINDDIQAACVVLSAMTEKWRTGQKMLSTYRRLSRGTLRIYSRITFLDRGEFGVDNEARMDALVSINQVLGLDEMVPDTDTWYWWDLEPAALFTQ